MINEQSLTNDRPLAVIASNSSLDSYNLAEQFAENGYDLIITAVNASVVEEAEDLKEYGIEAVSFQFDLSSPEGVEQLYKKIVATGRPVEAIVINTGMSEDLTTVDLLASKILKDMEGNHKGRILIAGIDNEEEVTDLVESLKERAEGSGVTIHTLQPGNTEISFLRKIH